MRSARIRSAPRTLAQPGFVLSLERRRVLDVDVARQPHAAWAAQQIIEAIGADLVPVPLIRDRDGIFGAAFDARVDHLGIRQLKIAPCQRGSRCAQIR